MKIEYTGDEVNGKNLVEAMHNSDVRSITIESMKEPSIGFLDYCHKNFGFYTEKAEEVGDKFITVLRREE